MVQADVLEKLEDPALAVYVVWEPILRTDDERFARKAVALLPDARVHHFWAATKDVGRGFQDPIGLTTEPAWDVYLVYPPGPSWDGADPPRPELFMHQLGGRLPEPQRLNGPELARRLQEILDRP